MNGCDVCGRPATLTPTALRHPGSCHDDDEGYMISWDLCPLCVGPYAAQAAS